MKCPAVWYLTLYEHTAIQMDVRCKGESYPTSKDMAAWERYERKRDFEAWKDTRVLYKNV